MTELGVLTVGAIRKHVTENHLQSNATVKVHWKRVSQQPAGPLSIAVNIDTEKLKHDYHNGRLTTKIVSVISAARPSGDHLSWT